MRLIRVFPRKTKATPIDALAYFGPPDLFAEADEVHVSVAFTYDKAIAERLVKQWEVVAPVKLGGVAYGDAGADFVPGRYIKPGYIFTSPAAVRVVVGSVRFGSAILFRVYCRLSTAGTFSTTICLLVRVNTLRQYLLCCGGRSGVLSLLGD